MNSGVLRFDMSDLSTVVTTDKVQRYTGYYMDDAVSHVSEEIFFDLSFNKIGVACGFGEGLCKIINPMDGKWIVLNLSNSSVSEADL